MAKVWDGCCAAIDRRLLTQEDGAQAAAFRFLRGCQKKAQAAVPKRAAQALADWKSLSRHLHEPGKPGEVPAAKLQEACERRGFATPAALLEAAYGPLLAGEEAADAETLGRVTRGVLGFFHPDEDAAF